jgi:excisionase family DNA binding protein
VAQAASALGVSVSTIWRWIDAGRMPAFRLGPKAIRIKKEDAESALTPASDRVAPTNAMRIYDDPEEAKKPPTDDEIERLRAAIAGMDAVRESIRKRRKGVPLPSSAPLIRESREERSRRG